MACDENLLYEIVYKSVTLTNGKENKTYNRITLEISFDEPIESLGWVPLGEKPALRPSAAASLALSEAEKKYGVSESNMQSISLQPHQCKENWWFYVILFQDHKSFPYYIGVLMDGTVVLPKVNKK